VNFCQVEIFPIREDISSDRSRAPATRKRAAAAAGQEGGLPPPPLLLPPAPAPAPAPAPGIPYIIRESAASENRITSCSAVVSKRSVPLRHSVETLHSRFSHSSRIPRFYVISTSKSREIARPADSEKSASLKPPRHFLVFAPIYLSLPMHARVYLPAGFTVLIFTFAPHPATAPRTVVRSALSQRGGFRWYHGSRAITPA